LSARRVLASWEEVRGVVAIVGGLALAGCSQNPVTPLPEDGGVRDSSVIVEAGVVDASMDDRSPIPDGDVLYDAPGPQLAAPTFTPPAPVSLFPGSTVVINAPPGRAPAAL
jgi:hypothetical protein